MQVQTSLESTAKVGSFQQEKDLLPVKTKMVSLIPGFLRHGQYEMFFSPQTVQKYKESLEWIIRDLGDIAVEEIDLAHVTILKQKIIVRGAGEARVASMVFALKSFLKYCKEPLGLIVLDTGRIKSPKRNRRDVIYLSNEEIKQYVESIKIENKDHKHELIERFADPKIYKSDEEPISIFMAGSPGAGKTEASKGFVERFIGRNPPVRIDADDIRTIFPNYTGSNSHIFQRACTLGVNLLFNHVLHNNITAILDGTFAYERAMENIERSLKHNRRVEIYYLFQDPAIAWKFTQIREAKEGRRVSKEVFSNSFLRARANVEQAKAHFGDKIELNLVLKDFSKSFEKLYDDIERLDKYLPTVYTKEELEKLLL